MKVAEIEVHYTAQKHGLPKLDSIESAEKLIRPFFAECMEYRESFKVVLVSSNNSILGIHTASIGGLAGTTVDIRQLFGVVLKANAPAIIIAHNHPSGELRASASDIILTKKINEGCKLLDIKLLDHFIFTVDAFYSFVEEGLL